MPGMIANESSSNGVQQIVAVERDYSSLPVKLFVRLSPEDKRKVIDYIYDLTEGKDPHNVTVKEDVEESPKTLIHSAVASPEVAVTPVLSPPSQNAYDRLQSMLENVHLSPVVPPAVKSPPPVRASLAHPLAPSTKPVQGQTAAMETTNDSSVKEPFKAVIKEAVKKPKPKPLEQPAPSSVPITQPTATIQTPRASMASSITSNNTSVYINAPITKTFKARQATIKVKSRAVLPEGLLKSLEAADAKSPPSAPVTPKAAPIVAPQQPTPARAAVQSSLPPHFRKQTPLASGPAAVTPVAIAPARAVTSSQPTSGAVNQDRRPSVPAFLRKQSTPALDQVPTPAQGAKTIALPVPAPIASANASATRAVSTASNSSASTILAEPRTQAATDKLHSRPQPVFGSTGAIKPGMQASRYAR